MITWKYAIRNLITANYFLSNYIENIIIVKHLQMSQILAFSNAWGGWYAIK